MEEGKIIVPRIAHFNSIGATTEQAKDVWIVLHGYGQLARFFIRHFEPIASESTRIIAPEGLSKFYLDGHAGRIGASWMTREQRLDEIQDQIKYLDLLVQHQTSQHQRLHVLGFSQGVATAWRWLMQGETHADSFIIWAGTPPEEWEGKNADRFRHMHIAAGIGTEDPFDADKKSKATFSNLQTKIPHLKLFSFDGGHSIHGPTLSEVVSSAMK